MSSFARTLLGAIAAAALVAACNSTPTVPVPPPEFCGIEATDVAGLYTASCEAGQTARNVALVYNENWGQGVMQETNEDGSFAAEIEASPGDAIIIQIKYGNRLSAEVYQTVPTE